MRRVLLPFTLLATGLLVAIPLTSGASCVIGGHDETSENFSPGGWATNPNFSPGSVPVAPFSTHLMLSEIAPRGCGTGANSDSSEFIEIYNPTTRPISFNDKYVSDDIAYYRTVNGPYLAANASDWTLKFPPGLVLSPGRVLVLCVTKAGFAGSGASAAGAQYFLEMKDSNVSGADDMVPVTTNSAFPVTGGVLTNPAANNGEWVVLFCWDGASDLVCDVDYASWGANSASNPKMDKSGVSMDGPDAGAVASGYNADTPAASQTNLGTALARPNTYQRIGGEVGEVALGGNGCVGRVSPTLIGWVPVTGGTGEPNIRFQVRWTNTDEDVPSTQFSGTMASQPFGVFLQDFGTIGNFNVPPIQPASFFDVFFEVPLSSLPPAPQKIVPGGNSPDRPALATAAHPATALDAFPCPADTNWAGNVDIVWSGPGQAGQVNRHYSDLRTCPGATPSFVHFKNSSCPGPMPWSVSGLCPGFTATLVNEDFSAAPNPLPVGWTGWIQVNAAAAVVPGTSCCFSITFGCNGVTSTIDICTTACDCQPANPTPGPIDWSVVGTTVHFHQRWDNPSTSVSSLPVSGDMLSQRFGVFLPSYGTIGHFDVPPMPPTSFFDVFFDVPLASLPPEPARQGGPPAGVQCFPAQWHGNVNVSWTGAGGSGTVGRHFDEVPVCAGGDSTYLFVETDCLNAVGASWTLAGLCPGFSATLVNLDHSPAPNPVPSGWIGYIRVSASPGTPVGTPCCFQVLFQCGGVAAVIDVCAKVCPCPRRPVLTRTDWTRFGSNVGFHLHWENPNGSEVAEPVSGSVHSQAFGAFLPDQGLLGNFDVPPLQPMSFFDVFFSVPLSSLPNEPQQVLPGGGPPPGSPCPQDTSWSGNVDIQWNGQSGGSQVNRHFTSLLVRPGSGSSHVHTLVFCADTAGATWAIAGLCPGWHATLLNENFTPAPNPVPPGWTGWISVAADAGVASGSSCCFTVTFWCAGVPGVIDVCAEACLWPTASVLPNPRGVGFGIYNTAPNPTSGEMLIGFAMPRAGDVRLEIFDLGGHRVRALLDGHVEAGMNAIRWDGRGERDHALAPGTYFVRLKAGERISSKRISLYH